MTYRAVVALLGLLATPLGAQRVPGVRVWIAEPSSASPQSLQPGAVVPARVSADAGAYLVAFRVTPDGGIAVLIPSSPNASYRVPKDGLGTTGADAAFWADSVEGVGHVFAVSSDTPFDFSTVRSGDQWDMSRLPRLPSTDPTAIAESFVRAIVPSRETAYGMNDVAYTVGGALADGVAETHTMVTYVPSRSAHIVASDPFDDYYGYGYWGSRYAGWNSSFWYPGSYWYNGYWYSPYGYGLYGAGSRGITYKICPSGAIVPVRAACSVRPVHPPTRSPSPRKPLPIHTKPLPPMIAGPRVPITSTDRGVPGLSGSSREALRMRPSTPRPVPPVVRPSTPGRRPSRPAPPVTPRPAPVTTSPTPRPPASGTPRPAPRPSSPPRPRPIAPPVIKAPPPAPRPAPPPPRREAAPRVERPPVHAPPAPRPTPMRQEPARTK